MQTENDTTKPETELKQEAGEGCLVAASLDSLKGLKGNEYRKAWNKLHRVRMREVGRAWNKRNPEKVKAHLANLRTRPECVKKAKDKWRNTGEGKKKYYSGAESASMRYQRWGDVEDCMVMDRKIPDRQLSLEIGRSVMAIQMRRRKLISQNLEENVKVHTPLPATATDETGVKP